MQRAIKLLAQENPMIDVVANVSQSFLKKYDLPPNATVIPTPKLMPIYEDLLKNFQCEFRPAGSAFNTLRACQVKLLFNFSMLFNLNSPNQHYLWVLLGMTNTGPNLKKDLEKME